MPSSGYIYTCKSVSFTVGGTPYDVSELTMTLAISTIPEVKLQIAPEKSSEGTAHIRNLSLSDLGEALEELLHKAEELTECNLSLVIEKHEAATGSVVLTQELNLNGWILCSVGLEDVTTTSSFYMSVTIKHPIYRLSLIGGFWTNLDVCPNLHESEVQSASDVLDAGVKGYETLLTALDAHPLDRLYLDTTIKPTQASPDDIMGVIRSKFHDVPELLEKYLEWKPDLGGGESPFPVWDLLSDSMQNAMRELTATSWLYSEGSSEHSVWDGLMSVVSSMDLAVFPYFWKERLPIAPRFPWMPVDFDVEEGDVYSLTFPGTDPCPIFGLCGTPDTVGGAGLRMVTVTNDDTELEESKSDATSLAFVPKLSYDANGKFMSVSMPSWLASVLAKGAGYNNQYNTFPDMEDDIPQEDPGGGDNEATERKNTCEMVYLSSVFSRSFKEFVESRVNCAFMPKALTGEMSEQDWLVPTKVMAFKTEGKSLFEGYITSVSHHISMTSTNATTNISVAHCRPEGGYEVTNEYGYKHPMYS